MKASQRELNDYIREIPKRAGIRFFRRGDEGMLSLFESSINFFTCHQSSTL
jgi:hypothetical protein